MNCFIKRLLVVVGMFAAVVSAAGELSLPDPGFEHGSATHLGGWGGGTWSPPGIPRCEATVVDTVAHTGKRSLYLRGIHPRSIAWLEWTDVPVAPGERIQITSWLKPESAMFPNSLIRVQTYFFDAKGRALNAAEVTGDRVGRPAPVLPWDGNAAVRNTQAAINQDFSGLSQTWMPVGFAFTVPANAATMRWRVTLIGEGAVYVDDVSVERNPSSPPPSLPLMLWLDGKVAVERDDDGNSVILFTLQNVLAELVSGVCPVVRCEAGEVGRAAEVAKLLPGESKTFRIPVQFPEAFTSTRAEMTISADVTINGRAQPESWRFYMPVEPRCLSDAVRLDRWGEVPLLGNSPAEFIGVVTTTGGRRTFTASGGAVPLALDSTSLAVVMRFDNPGSAQRLCRIEWEALDYYWRSSTGSFDVKIPAGRSMLMRVLLPELQLNHFKQVLYDGGSEFFRFSYRGKADASVLPQQDIKLTFVKPPERSVGLQPLPPREVELPVFGKLRLVDEVLCGVPEDRHLMRQGGKGLMAKYSSAPLGYYGGSEVLSYDWQKKYRDSRDEFSRVETLLGRPCRVTSDNGWFSYKLGRNSLIPGRYYLLEIEYPEDVSRNFLLSNRMYTRGNVGFSTGGALWDSPNRQRFMQRYDLPLSGEFRCHRTIMQAVRPEDWFSIHTTGKDSSPGSSGAAVYAMRLYELGDENSLGRFALEPSEPEGLPSRVIGHLAEDGAPNLSTLPLYKIYGHNVFAPLTLSYCGTALAVRCGNLGQVRYASKLFGPEGQTHPMALRHKGYFHVLPGELSNYLKSGEEFNLPVMPVLEYGGTARLPAAALAVNPDGSPVFFRWGSANAPGGGARVANQFKDGWAVDMAHPAVGEDLAKLVTELADLHPQIGGIVLTLRFQAWQVGYGPETLAAFSRDTGIKLPVKDAAQMVCKRYLDRFMQWHYQKKCDNFVHAAQALHERHPNVKLMILNYNNGDDNLNFGNPLYVCGSRNADRLVPGGVAFPDLTGVDLVALSEDYRRHEQQEMSVGMNPRLYNRITGLYNLAPVRYPYLSGNQNYLDAFRTGEGSAVCFWWLYNEDAVGADTYVNVPPGLHGAEASGRFSMLDEVLTMAASDPFVMFFRIGEFNRGYIEYAREFARAYRALPAVSSEILKTDSDNGIVIRRYATARGVFFAVINTALTGPGKARIAQRDLPAGTVLCNIVTGERPAAESGGYVLPAEAVSLQAFRAVQP